MFFNELVVVVTKPINSHWACACDENNCKERRSANNYF